MSRRVAIVGIGQTRHEESKDHWVYWENDYEAAKAALADAALKRTDIDTVIVSGWDAIDGRTLSDMHTSMAAGGYLKDSTHVGDDAIIALAYGYMRIASGLYDTCLAAGHGHREASVEAVTRIVFDPLFARPVARNHTITQAMQANAYLHKFGVSEEQAARVVVKNRQNGTRNPYAHLRQAVSVEDVLASPPVAYPLKALDCPPESVGGVAVILAAEEVVRRITDRPVWIGASAGPSSMSWGTGTWPRCPPQRRQLSRRIRWPASPALWRSSTWRRCTRPRLSTSSWPTRPWASPRRAKERSSWMRE
jgi:acetyl-CoA C-acetyltransferase